MIRFNANLYRIAMLCSSQEETRYYLQGAFIERHPVKGVTMTATDGHKLVVVYDETGFADESAIIKLTPEALKACKPGRDERRDVVISTRSADAWINITTCDKEGISTSGKPTGNDILTDTPVTFSKDCKIDGTFPDYRRVFPSPIEFDKTSSSPSFSALVLSTLNTIAVELHKHYSPGRVKGAGTLRINASSTNSPALVTFAPEFNAVAVAMPMRAILEDKQPEWFRAVAPLAQAAE
jgi:DNA polymerase III sliding clamp (beta) subunit (PCNA family)